ncbi:hypothetical protein OCT63_19685 [Vibrio sp. RW]|uniref:hypothetical protein n=1 Tax=Vibrio sp. RW TaxID=2998833 RepID=UPI0022CD51EF|nr:hypothetical protein [Vibrio sp. RW]MDA0146452.1 hypothetical protein [Vibrio sp. RW]
MLNAALKLIPANEPVNDYFQTQEEIEKEFEISAKTSIARRSVSAPLKQFLAQYSHLVSGSTLNYAKGREKVSLDTEALKAITGVCQEYDYTFANNIDILNCSYNTVYCGYCTNTLPPLPRAQVWETLARLCSKEKGIVVVSARSNTDRGIVGEPCFDGVRTKLGTYQIGYPKNALSEEAKKVFPHVVELKTKGAFRMVVCSHNPIDI